LERIIESAVDLSGAERGSVLLVDERGQLSPHITHARPSDEAQELFSRSIAEAVLIDGEPIVTVDALSDGRLQSYVSVHKLMLRSVACLPIRSPTGILGVLYLEHRRSRGRFSDQCVDLLCAFADQAAIALENARLVNQIRQQKAELEAANRDLTHAKAQLEDTLLTRTRQLDDVQRELARATQARATTPKHGMVGKSPGMQRLFDAITRLSNSSVPVVIRGETGTGKELVARAVHYAGPRASGPFVTIDCGSLPESLLESELFGYVKGAFSGADRDRRGLIAAASGGTLFLDELSEMPPKMQAGLLRVLQERKVCRLGSDVDEAIDVRLVTATRKPLAELVTRGQFREDLLYRLSVVEVVVPALRERREDIPQLCDHLLAEFAGRESVPRCHLTRAALAALMAQPWPGNVRQLGHVLLQACVMSDGPLIDVGDLTLAESNAPVSVVMPMPMAASIAPQRLMVENLSHHRLEEKQRILHALEAAGWNRVKAAQSLGMPRRTFYRRLVDYSIIERAT
jgi:transcriptional regulator with GAF, ATPase, and Fis domain